MHELIIVEGLPCSGKSTTAKYIADKFNMQYFDEGSGRHPADYEFHAFVQMSELKKFPIDEQNKIIEKSEQKFGGIIVPLSEFHGDLFEKLLQYKIYDFLPWETEKPVMLDKWREFADNKKPNEKYVFNCVLLQNPMCETMMRFGFSREKSAEYIGEICSIIKPMNPIVVYLKNSNICESVKKAVSERGDDWLNMVIDYHCNGVYGKLEKLSGFEGYISALEERQRRELEILSGADIDYIVPDDPQKNWEAAYRELDKMLI
ncbi:MAG: hypothetical protein K2K44_09945 [Oscillospiraceae bacterium]|nr:hypothetical protein [Oscillospiraceae bacterium]